MPISIRLKPALEQRLAEYAVRKGTTKSAVVATGVEDYLDRNAGPTLYALYEPIIAAVAGRTAGQSRGVGSVRERYAAYVKAKHARRARR